MRLYESRNNFGDMLEVIIFSITMTLVLIRIYFFIFKKREIEFILKSTPDNFHIHSKVLTLENTQIIKKTLQEGSIVTLIYCGVMLSANATFTILSPLLTPAVSSVNSTEIIRPLPVRVWLPFDQMISPYYEIAYVLTTFSCLFLGTLVISLELFFFIPTIYLTGQFELLSDSLSNMRTNVNTLLLHSHDPEEETYFARRYPTGMMKCFYIFNYD